MTKKLLLICLAEAAVLITLILLTKHMPHLFSSVMTFPFEQVAGGLSLLSKAGRLGNGIAAALWIGISAIPAIIALRYPRGKETLLERTALYLLSALVLLALYGIVNPQAFLHANAGALARDIKLINAIFGVSVWTLAVCFIILRLIRLFRKGNKEQLLQYMRAILYVLCILFTATASVSLTNGLLNSPSAQTGMDAAFEVFRLVLMLVPYFFDVAIILQLLSLLGIAAKEGQDGVVDAAKRVSATCCMALGTTAGMTALYHIVQILAMPQLSKLSAAVSIPVIDIAFIIMILLFSRLLIENKQLRDDNSLFI